MTFLVLFSNKIFDRAAEFTKCLSELIANMEDPDQTASSDTA